MTMNLRFTMIAASLIAGCATISDAQAAPSTFQQTCLEISINQARLTAKCRRVDGQTFRTTSIDLWGIANIDGALRFDINGGPSSYPRTCRAISISGNVLSAICKTRSGAENPTSMVLPGIANRDGALVDENR